MVLDQINDVNDIKKLNEEELEALRAEIRQFLVESIARTGGHLASNLGVVELTMALHLSFDPTVDKIVWDVGHQSYTHKILTGRKGGFVNLREYGGMSGFPNTGESDTDSFNTGHSFGECRRYEPVSQQFPYRGCIFGPEGWCDPVTQQDSNLWRADG